MNRKFLHFAGSLLCHLFILITGLFFLTSTAYSQVNFQMTTLNGATLDYSSTLQFGPDGRLYVGNTVGQVRIFTITKTGANSYTASNYEVVNIVKDIPNHNDDLTPFTTDPIRQVTGLLVTGTAEFPVIYVTSSDPRIGGGGEAGDVNIDTNSGILSKLTWNGTEWEKVDLVRGLPRSEENHSVNGIQIDFATNTLYMAVGGHTNAGGPSTNFAFSNEYALSAAILKIDLNVINSLPVRGTGNDKYIYDLPTLNDPTRNDIANPDYNPSLPGSPQFIDEGDPFGGHDGLNMAKLVQGGPVQIYSAGYRNPYDIVLTKTPGREGRLYTIDNGANGGWGGYPKNVNTPQVNNEYMVGEPGSSTNYGSIPMINNTDNLHLVSKPGMAPIYGGHPNPIRANPAGAGLSWRDDITGIAHFSTSPTTDWPPVPLAMADPAEANFLMPGAGDNALSTFYTSTNGIDEYRSPNFFNGQLVGDLFAVDFVGTLWRMKLNAEGTAVVNKEIFATGFSPTPLDVTVQGAGEIFDGTIWVCDYTSNQITIFTPEEEFPIICTGDNTSTVLDDDHDGYTNADETSNGTNPCNPLSIPKDFDGDHISDKNDVDDDNDGIPDTQDAFHRDATNGTGSTSTILYPFLNSTPGSGLFGLGFTGLMSNGTQDPDAFYDPLDPGLIMGGAVGLASFPANAGSAVSNTQKNGFQFGYKMAAVATKFTVESSLIGPFFNSMSLSQLSPQFRQGIFIGTGTQSDYLMAGISVSADGSSAGIRVMKETNNIVDLDLFYPVAGLLSASNIYLFMDVDPANGAVVIRYSTNQSPVPVTLGSPVPLSGILRDKIVGSGEVIATGLIAQAGGVGTYAAQYDYLNIIPESQSATTIRINAGGPQFVSGADTWTADNYFTGGDTYEEVIPINGTTNDQLYQSERYGQMQYAIPVAPGSYTLKLHFAEIYYTTAGSRVFNVNIENGQAALNNFDIVAEAGGGFTAIIKQFNNINVTDGVLNINFTNVFDNAKISGIEVISGGSVVNAAPVVANPVADQTLTMGSTSTQINLANLFTDDGGLSNLTLSVSGNTDPAFVTGAVISSNQLQLTIAGGVVDTAFIKIKATDAQGLFAEDEFRIIVAEGTAPSFQLRINTGGPAFTNAGISWSADQYFTGGSTYNDAAPISGTINDQLYQSERFGNLSYAIPVPAGAYTVKLHFAEIYYTLPGSRTFNVNVENGQRVLNNYDIVSQSGGGFTAIVEQFNLNVTDGFINIQLTGVLDNAKISGIEIIAAGAAVNNAPVVSNAIADREVVVNTAAIDIDLTNVFSDDGGLSNLTFSINGNTNPALVSSALITANQLHLNLTAGLIDSTRITVRATDAQGLFREDDFRVNVINGTPAPLHLRINAGGTQFINSGLTWAADQYFSGGSVYSEANPIAGTTNDQLYISERYGPVTYSVPVPAGSYTVKLHFAEIFYTTAGARVFNVNVENGQGALTNFDIVADAGGGFTAVIKEFQNINVSDGFLNISLVNVEDNAKISGIEIIGAGGLANSAPVIITPVTDKQVALGSASSVVSIAGVFSDDGGAGNLTYTVTSNSNPALVTSANIAGANLTLGYAANLTGSALIKVRATDVQGLFVEDEFMVTVASQAATHIRIASGGAGHVFEGVPWSADQYYSGGNAYNETIPIANTTNDLLYQNERWGNVTYNIPVPVGAYTVKLHFAEIFWTTAGNRIFNINVESGQGVANNFDIVAQSGAGATAVIQQFNNVNVTDGFVTITLTSVSDNAKISGIEIISGDNTRKINSSFTARASEHIVDLDWTTTLTEGSVTVERSADGKNYESVYSSRAADKAGKTIEGSYADMNPLPGTSWYRLKTTAKAAGSVSYSEAKHVIMKRNVQSFMVYPNPSRGILYVELPKQAGTEEKLAVRIISLNGAVVYQQSQPERSGVLLKLNLPSSLANGTYILEIDKNGKRYPSRFVLNR